MAKAVKKVKPPSDTSQRTTRRKPPEPKAIIADEPMPKVVDKPTELAPVNVVVQNSQGFKWQTLVYIAVGAGLLFLLIRGCASDKKIVTAKKNIADTLQAVAVTQGSIDSMERLLKQRDSLTDEAMRLAKVSEEQRQQAQTELSQARQTIDQYLSKQKVQSNANFKVIQSGSVSQLMRYWDSVKVANGYHQ